MHLFLIIELFQDKKGVYDRCLEAFKAAECSLTQSIGIFISQNGLKPGMTWNLFKAATHLLKDANTGTRYIRLAFEDSLDADILKRKIRKNQKSIRNSLV